MKTTAADNAVVTLATIDRTQQALAGGKGANLAALARIDGIRVPDGFCITTPAFDRIVQQASIAALLDELAKLGTGDGAAIARVSAEIRACIEATAVPADIYEAIASHVRALGAGDAWAVRSSATAEDLPGASFAGQQDSYLNVSGVNSIVKHVSKCWASLFTERAVTYRIRNGFDHRAVSLAVVVQKMVFPEASGILFTADPVTSHRKVISIDAGFGLGEALVSGLVNADHYQVRGGEVIDKKIGSKNLAVYTAATGGTEHCDVPPGQQEQQVLTDGQILELEQIGRSIEAHFGQPQDIEWCLSGNEFYIVQSRPITTLFPVPAVADADNHIYVSVGHQQMMTDAMRPLGLSVWLLSAARRMETAGGRLFVDVTQDIASPAGRNLLINVLGKSDPLVRDAMTTILEREEFASKYNPETSPAGDGKPHWDYQAIQDFDSAVVAELIHRAEASIAELKRDIDALSGTELIDFILADLEKAKARVSDPQSFQVIMTGFNAASWINEQMAAWLGEKNVADALSQSVPHNVTSEMGLALLDVADVIRPFPEVIEYLQKNAGDDFLEKMATLNGGTQAREAIQQFLDRYGMRCAGEIDITQTRWAEKPAILIPMILGNIKNQEPGAGKRKFEQGMEQAKRKEEELLGRLRQLPEGGQKVAETKRMIDLLRNLAGYREYPKYNMVSRYFVYKQALLREAQRLVQERVIDHEEDIYFLDFHEIRNVIASNRVDFGQIAARKDAYELYRKLSPPRVMTSEGEIITAKYNRNNLPADALAGLPVSAGVVEGRARVILNLEDADLEEGDILVTKFTDPSWTPLFVAVKGLVTEVGGLMTHGAVIAREYGLPAVVSVENATRLIADGQRIRVHGTDGYVEFC
ncbi:rifamycin-inactivating phosphotransferase [Dyadobacter fermentans]|uniref:Prodigiosin synthesizing transferase PigC n=1 Tax=Dyadobacter fermentans (strain ATCC 700827 / DSM 18053 / CIP 107007 / KCTC 52180 / NS114) TaxID=471854 RepID=C6W150_DYAFD|nr:rifamycin-inactivating phosphotransferase [Dyadobacter fermentans]ACT91907.1 pyruvate phosphate dikinase PEP/pyruvate- binding [Dyadobacter fermentans DSM 18053]